MNTFRIFGACLAIFCSSALFTCYAAEPFTRPWSGRVRVDVAAGDSIKSQVTSYINRELRALNDVTLADAEPEYILSIIASEIVDTTGNAVVYAIAVIAIRPFDETLIASMVQPKYKSTALNSLKGLTYYPASAQYWGSDIQKLCRNVVADYDARVLEKERKSHREIMDFLRSEAQKKKASK